MYPDEKQDFTNDFLIDLNKYTVVKKISEDRFSKFELVKNSENSKNYILQTFRYYNQSSYYENKDQDARVNNFIYDLVKFNHSTFIRFYGFSTHDFEGDKNISILVNYEENGSLFQLFKKIKKPISSLNFTNTNKQIILIGIARSMILLSKYNIINGNLKPENIFLDENFYPHLTNFCTLQLNTYQSTIYSSPEFFETLKFDRKSDVYSYSIILYEMITSKKPFSELENLSNFQKNKKILNNYRPKFSTNIKEKHQQLIEKCWSSNPSERPSFEEIFYKLSYDEKYYLENVDKEAVQKYINSIKDDLIFCAICHKNIEKKDLIYYSLNPYHKDCIKCSVCNKKINQEIEDDEDEFVCVTPKLFLCKDHYNEIERNKKMPPKIELEYKKQIIDKITDDIFNPPSLAIDNILDYQEDEIFIDSDTIGNSFQFNQPFENFFPTVEFRFESSPQEFDVLKFQSILNNLFNDEATIYNVKSGSTILKIAFLTLADKEDEIIEKVEKIKNELKRKTTLGVPILGNFDEQIHDIPKEKDIKSYFKHYSDNLFQFVTSLNIDPKEIKEKIKLKYEKRKKSNKNLEFLFKNIDLFEQADKQFREDLKNSKYELVVKCQTILANKYLDRYKKIKQLIPEDEREERFLYHGTKLENHQKILENHFIIPTKNKQKSDNNNNNNNNNNDNDDYDKIQKHDSGWYGKGIYATDNIFYALSYCHFPKAKIIEYNEVSNVILCKAIYNKNKINKLSDIQKNKEIPEDIAKNYGVNYAFIGSNNGYRPIQEKDSDNHYVAAGEFAFPNSEQVFPIVSYLIGRVKCCTIWKDEKVTNKTNSGYLSYFSTHINENIYSYLSNDEGITCIKKKKNNVIKLISNGGGPDKSGQAFIKEAREIVGSDFVCLVFAKNKKHLDWISKEQNILFTVEPRVFKKFVTMEMTKENVIKFAYKNKEEYPMININEETIFNFIDPDSVYSKKKHKNK